MTREELIEKIAASLSLTGHDYNAAKNAARRIFAAIEAAGFVVVQERHWNAVCAALQSYKYGNSSAELADKVLQGVAASPLKEVSSDE